MPNYYLHRDGENQGPYPTEELKRKVASGEIKADELVCKEGTEDWVKVGTLTKPTAPRATMLGHSHSHSAAVSTMSQRRVTLEQVNAAKLKMNLPILGIVFSVLIPPFLWFIRAELGNNENDAGATLLPIVTILCVAGLIASLVWFRKAQKQASVLKATYEHQRG